MGLRIEGRLKAEWGVLDDKNELACSWLQVLHIGPDLSGTLACEGLLAIFKAITPQISVHSVPLWLILFLTSVCVCG